MRRRLVYKNGECNITQKHIRMHTRHYLADIFTTLVDLKWRWSLLIFLVAFVSTWLLFGLIWWIIGYTHDDFNPDVSKRPQLPCVNAVVDFPSALLYSVETQHTIGYGYRVLTTACPEAIVVLMIQSIIGTVVQTFMAGMIFAKLSRPKKRAETLLFSKYAIICLRDGVLSLMFRIGDMRSSHLIGAQVRGLIVRRRVTKEGEVLPLDNQDVNLGFGDGSDRLLIMWPVIATHKITETSPFWRMSKADLEKENFELIVVLEGSLQSTGATTQARTSYLPSEILWGHRLERLVTFQKDTGHYQVDYTRFDSVIPLDTPSCSAQELAAQHNSTDDSEEETAFTLLRADLIDDELEESDDLLIPDGSTAICLDKLSSCSSSSPDVARKCEQTSDAQS